MNYDEYISELQRASAECWKCFTVSRANMSHASEIFSSLRMKYRNRKPLVYEYVNRYLDALNNVLGISEDMMNGILDASKQIWRVFKSVVKSLYETDEKDDSRFFYMVVSEFISISDKDWNSEIEGYVRRYICACVDEIDRSYRRKYEIQESQV